MLSWVQSKFLLLQVGGLFGLICLWWSLIFAERLLSTQRYTVGGHMPLCSGCFLAHGLYQQEARENKPRHSHPNATCGAGGWSGQEQDKEMGW